MADASVSKSDICEYVGVQVPPRPPHNDYVKSLSGLFFIIFSKISANLQSQFSGTSDSELVQLKLNIETSVGDSTPTEAT